MKNLFKKQSAKFVQNPSSFTKVMAKHILVCFLCPTVYNSQLSCLDTVAPISRLLITVDNSSTLSTSSDVQTSLSVVEDGRGDGGRTASGGHGRRHVLTFVAGVPLPHVRCIAVGGFPPPGVAVFLDHRDITARFDVVQRSSLHGVHGLQVTTFDPTNMIAIVVTLWLCSCKMI